MTPDEAIGLLRGDPLRHIVSLKMLALHGENIDLRFVSESEDWALLSMLPTHLSEYDARAYATARWVVLVDGNSESLKLRLLEDLPRVDLVLKTYDDPVKYHVTHNLAAKPVATFASFSAPSDLTLHASDADLESSTLSPEAARVFSQVGYPVHELEKYFHDDARWFGIRKNGSLVSACFVHRNFDSIWEIAGVFTDPKHRRQRLAAAVVTAALKHLLQLQRRPRYQVAVTNTASTQLARSIGLHEFLRVEHFLIPLGATAA